MFLLTKFFATFLSPCGAFLVVQKVHVWHHDCHSSEYHSQGLRRRRSCSFLTLLVSAKISYFCHGCDGLYWFPSRYCTQDIAFSKSFRKIRRSRCCSFRRSNPAILCWICWSSASDSRFVSCCSTVERGVSRILLSTALFHVSPYLFDSLDGSHDDLASWSRWSYCSYCEFDSSTTRDTLEINWIFRKSSSCVFIHTAFLNASAMCRRERLYVTVFGKIAILSPERALNCTNIQYFYGF